MTGRGGPIGLFARHPTAANLLMILMILGGVFALMRLNTQFFPNFGIDIISVNVEWSGAGAEDVDAKIVQAIEPEVRFLDGVKHVKSTSVEGRATIVVEFDPGTDMQSALSDVETAVGQITILPEDSDRPEIHRIVRYDTISRLVLSGPYPETALKAYAKRIRDEMIATGVNKVDLSGARDEEIWVEVRPETLLELDLTLADIASRIGATSQDLPSGETAGAVERQIRSLGLVKDAQALGRIEVRSFDDGRKIYLRDVAAVSENFDEDGQTLRRHGNPAIELHVQRAFSADALKVADRVNATLAKLRAELPPNLRLEQYDIAADLIRGRVDLLVRNGLGGLILVLAVLFIFLNSPVAFWVAVGIPVSILATMVIMLFSGQSINMVSLFGLIMAIGIVVDDAIVVGEHAEARRREGMDPLAAAEAGARRMAAPVLSSSLTTIAAFTPLLVISDIIGEIIIAIPFVIIAVLVASLIECFLVLPGHLRGALARESIRSWPLRNWFDNAFERFREGPFRRMVRLAVTWRYTTMALAVGALILSVGLVLGGRIGFVFFPSPEADRVYANVVLAAGMSRDRTVAVLDELDRALVAADRRLTQGQGSLVRMALHKVGTAAGRGNAGGLPTGDHIGGIVVELAPSDERTIRTAAVIAAWRTEVKNMAGVESLTIVAARGGPPGREIDVRLSGGEIAGLKAGAEKIKRLLSRYPGVSDVEDDLPYGKQETILELTPHGQAMGFTTQTVGRQIRNAFEGAIATRFPRGDEEVKVRVRYPRDAVNSGAFQELYLRGPEGAEVSLDEAVQWREKRGFSRVKREDGARQVAITAEIDKSTTNTNKVLAALVDDGIAEIVTRHSLRTFSFAGRAEEQRRTLGDMRIGAGIGLTAIYIILAWVFASYTRPIVVMSVIPLGFVGAALGHWLLGFNLTILSLVALIGLSGIVVNDSIILVSTIDERLRRGEPWLDAIVDGTRDRLRAVILTSATTIGGLTPLMFERSLQAQFLIPMAVTIVFGLMVTTLLVLLVVPAWLGVQQDFGRLFGRWGKSEGIPAAAGEDD